MRMSQPQRRCGRGGCGAWLRAFFCHQPEHYALHRKTNLSTAAGLALHTAMFAALAWWDSDPAYQTRRVPSQGLTPAVTVLPYLGLRKLRWEAH